MLRQLLSPIPAIIGKGGWGAGRGKEVGVYLRGRQIARNPRRGKIDAADTISPLYTVKWINHSPRLPTSRRSARRGGTSSYFPCFHSQISSTSIHVPALSLPQNGSGKTYSSAMPATFPTSTSRPYVVHRELYPQPYPRFPRQTSAG